MGVPANFSASKPAKSNSDVRGRITGHDVLRLSCGVTGNQNDAANSLLGSSDRRPTR
jgi:hypothetical protein